MNALTRSLRSRPPEIVRQFLGWWLRSLAVTIPGPLRRLPSRWRDNLAVEFGPDNFTVRHCRAGSRTIVCDGVRGDVLAMPPPVALRSVSEKARSRTVLLLPPSDVFRRHLMLPMAAEGNLRPIVANEIDRQTPFSSDDVYHDYRVVGRESTRGEIAVELAVVKRSIVDSAIAACRHWSIAPRSIGIIGDAAESQDEVINFLRAGGAGAWSFPALLNFVLAGIAVLVAAWALSLAYANLEADAAALAGQLERAKAQSRQADLLRKELERALSQTGFLARRRDQTSPLEIVHEITQTINDDGWVNHLQIAGKEARISGFAPNATQLLSTFDKSALFQNARFRAPVTRQSAGSDRYDISFDIRAGGKP
ncbi:MAG: hypothetical protein IT562_21950 [Alphaproteobacteria bacterium]|nr:hypothetical protein [Alphaproteobacteria bacterium]